MRNIIGAAILGVLTLSGTAHSQSFFTQPYGYGRPIVRPPGDYRREEGHRRERDERREREARRERFEHDRYERRGFDRGYDRGYDRR